MYTKLPVVESTHSTKTTRQKRLVSTYFVAFFTGYPAIYISAWLHGAKQNVTTHGTTACRDRLAGTCRSADAARTPGIHVCRS